MDGIRREVVDVLVRVTKRFTLPLIFLVASRPEQDIMLVMESVKVDVSLVPLDTEYRSDKDIERYLRDKILEIRDTHPLRSTLPPSWPSDADIRKLVRKSSGQFIYASTAVKYFSSRRHRPTWRLNIVLGVIPPTSSDLPFAELDALYQFLINSTENPQLTARILVAIGILDYPFTEVVDYVLSLEPGDSTLLLGDLGSLVTTVDLFGKTKFKILHASVGDFLGDPARSGVLYVDPGSVRAEVVCKLLHFVQQPEHPGEYISFPHIYTFNLKHRHCPF